PSNESSTEGGGLQPRPGRSAHPERGSLERGLRWLRCRARSVGFREVHGDSLLSSRRDRARHVPVAESQRTRSFPAEFAPIGMLHTSTHPVTGYQRPEGTLFPTPMAPEDTGGPGSYRQGRVLIARRERARDGRWGRKKEERSFRNAGALRRTTRSPAR